MSASSARQLRKVSSRHFYLYHEAKRDITAQQEHPTSCWDRASMRCCWEFLDMTSRSFAAVIKELDGDLARTICMYYLVLRGLDTIEDDMTIPDEKKKPILRQFHDLTVTPGWNFTGNGPDEKDRSLLLEYHTVVEEVNRLPPQYAHIFIYTVQDRHSYITQKMENGMADYAHTAATNGTVYLETIADYDLYCHYVAGLVGEGLTRIWSASGKEVSFLCDQLELANSMGLLLQKINIICNFREDVEERRFFWPREIWAKYGFNEMKDMYEIGMVLDALRHACDYLDYLRMLKNQSVFVFCTVPVSTAMATLSLCNMKIRKAEAACLIMRSTNTRDVTLIFWEYARKIHDKAKPHDPNFLKMCCKVLHAHPHIVRL
ncbi:isoprenoid synthase domain-containing protein [Suillus spraguei]|nr:isoprenoid synthase domain-containing protein [Suillus spraguei]